MSERRALLLSVGLALLVLYIARCTGQTDICAQQSSQRSCDMCIQAHPDCLWCPHLPAMNESMSIIHCYNRNTYNESECPEQVENPSSKVEKTEDRPLSMNATVEGDSVQVRPQAVTMNLRLGSPQSFNMSFIALRNTPLDVYFLLDVSASLNDTISTILENLEAIANTISGVSSAFRIGLGGFIDKDVFPYGGTTNYSITVGDKVDCNQVTCDLPIGYNHYLSLTDNITRFRDVLSAVQLKVNVDFPEGGLDALMQAAVCTDVIGWRDESRVKMVFIITDSDYHIAGDGYLAGLVKPNDMQCHMAEIPDEPGVYEYTYSKLQDYPSIHQLLGALEENLIVPIFAIQQPSNETSNIDPYTNLSEELRGAGSLAIPIFASRGNVDASEIINLINQAYENTSQNIQVNVPVIDGYRITIEPLVCKEFTGERSCRVSFDEIITFRVTVELMDCSAKRQMFQLRGPPYTFSEIMLVPECSCECSAEMFHQESHPACNENGTLVCAACRCNEGRFGTFCECDQEVTGGCVTFNGMECGGPERGTCSSCGECMCNTPTYFGADLGCRCDNTSCPAGCELNGECVCAEPPFCRCTRTAPLSGKLFFGSDCSCNPDELCLNTNWTSNGKRAKLCQVINEVNKTGNCADTCTGCDCSVSATGINGLVENNNLCVPRDSSMLCTYFAPCVACALRGVPTTECMSLCSAHPSYSIVPEVVIDSEQYFPACTTNVDGCDYEFYVQRQPFLHPVLIDQSSQNCAALPFWAPYVIAAALVLAIILIGLLILCILKIAFVFSDKRDYETFTKELQHADFAPHENPLYLTPQTEYKNPILRRHSSKRKQ